MEVIKKLEAGTDGTKRYTTRYGKRLVCVRYRLDRVRRRRFTTIELIVDEAPWQEKWGPDLTDHPTPYSCHPNQKFLIRVRYDETRLRERVKAAGGQWLPDRKLWRLPLREISRLGLDKRIVEET